MAASMFLSPSIAPKATLRNKIRTPTTHILASNTPIHSSSSSPSSPPPPPTGQPLSTPISSFSKFTSPLHKALVPSHATLFPSPHVVATSIGRHLFWLSALTPLCSLLLSFWCPAAAAVADDSIRASRIGQRIATALRGTGCPDEAIVFALASLPVLELRGAIPVGYWMQLSPLLVTALSIFGNMVPVPFILIYLKRFACHLSQRDEDGPSSAAKLLDALLQRAREKARPVKEFQWLGLMLFVAVPFPGTGAWTGATVASVLDMPFWTAFSANFVGVILAGLLVNLLVNLGLKYAIATGVLLFFLSTFMWSALRHLKRHPES